MAVVYDPVVVSNLVFDLIILGLGAFTYARLKSVVGGLIGLGFVFFSAYYILTILGYGGDTVLLFPLRVLGYLLVVVALAWLAYSGLSRAAASHAP